MRVAARVCRPGSVLVRTLGSSSEQRAGTVLLTAVNARQNLVGEILEINERRITPRQEIRGWPMMRYVASLGGYFDTNSGDMVSSAKAVYIVGERIYYLPEAS